jgi:Protein of unknown function (DUF2848)
MLQFLCLGIHQVSTLEFSPEQLIIAGWTGRDSQAVEHHIEELAAIGVPRPSSVPLFYRVGKNLLTQAHQIQVVGAHTSGEVEPVLVAMKDGLWLTVGSDHTDRSAETYSVALSKQLCPKVIADQAWALAEIEGHLDAICLRSWVIEVGDDSSTRVAYQEGTLASIQPLKSLVERYNVQVSEEPFSRGFLMSCGTVGAIGGIRPSKSFCMQLFDPVLNRTIEHRYDIECLATIA